MGRGGEGNGRGGGGDRVSDTFGNHYTHDLTDIIIIYCIYSVTNIQ